MKKDGFSLLEVIVSISIISILMPGVLCTINHSAKIRNEAQHMLQASDQAQLMIERARWEAGENFPVGTSTTLTPGIHPPSDIGLATEPTITNVGSPQWYYTVIPVAGFRKCEVTVTWEELS